MTKLGPREQQLGSPDPALLHLCEQASREHWRVEELDWTALALERITPATRVPLAALYTDVAYAEALGVRILQQVTEQAGSGILRSFALTQLADEQQHVRFFSLVAEQLGAAASVSPFLMQLSDDLRTVSQPDELLLHLHIVELATQSLFFTSCERARASLADDARPSAPSQPARGSVLALLRCVVERVGGDETRHVAFGAKYLQHSLAAQNASERRALAQRAARSLTLLYRAFELESEAFRGLVLHPHALLQQAFARVQQELALLGIELEVPSAKSR